MKAEVPVLKAPELGEVVLPGAVDERVLIDPTDARRVGPELRLHAFGKTRQDFAQVLEHARACPVEVGAVLEDDVDVRVAEVREPPDRLDLGRPEQRRGDGIRHLVLEDVGAPIPARVDDDLGVGEVGDRIERDVPDRPHGPDDRDAGQDEDEEPVPGAELDDPLDHA